MQAEAANIGSLLKEYAHKKLISLQKMGVLQRLPQRGNCMNLNLANSSFLTSNKDFMGSTSMYFSSTSIVNLNNHQPRTAKATCM